MTDKAVATKMRRAIQLKPGLILIRLRAGSKTPPAQFRAVLPKSEDDSITLMSNPLAEDAVLRRDGDCIVLRCARELAIQVEVQPVSGSNTISGSLDIEYLTAHSVERAPRPLPNQPAAKKSATPNDVFMAHISKHGDHFFALDEWIGSPTRSDPIEALSVRPDSHTLPQLVLRDCVSGQIAAPGEILGKRARNTPLRAMDIWLADDACPERLCVEALFRKGGHMRYIGARVSLVGAEMGDALLGLRLSLASPARKRTTHHPTSRVNIYKTL